MSKTNAIYDSYLNFKEVYTLGLRLIALIAVRLANDTIITMQIDKIKLLLAVFEGMLKDSKRNPHTETLHEKDMERHEDFDCIVNNLKSANHKRRLPAAQKAAKGILAVVEKYRESILHLGFVKKTATIRAFLKEIGQEENAGNIAILEMQGMIDNLAASNDAFEQEYQLKAEYDANWTYADLVKTSNEVIDRLKSCMSRVDTLAMDNPGVYDQLIAEINVIITDMLTVARSRKTRAANRNDKTDVTTDHPPVASAA